MADYFEIDVSLRIRVILEWEICRKLIGEMGSRKIIQSGTGYKIDCDRSLVVPVQREERDPVHNEHISYNLGVYLIRYISLSKGCEISIPYEFL